MRYAALLAASAAVVAVLTLPRDGRSEAAPVARLASTPSTAQARPTERAAARPAEAGRQEDFRWSGRVAQGKTVRIQGLLGNVHAELSSGDVVEVVGRRVGSDADQVRIEVVEGEDGVTVCTIYPGSRRNGRSGDDDNDGRSRRRGDNVCEGDNNDGEMEIDSDEARIDFTVRVPAGVNFDGGTVDGNITAEGLRSDVSVASVNGNVRVSTTGTARAATVSGNVDATFGETDGSGMEFVSVSGNVTLHLPGDVGAQVEAHTLSGDIESDFDLRMGSMTGGDDEDEDEDDEGGMNLNIQIGRKATGTIGRGGPELSVNTVSGNIRLLRSR